MIPIEFFRQFRFSGYAIFDFAVVYLGVYLLSPMLSKTFLKIRICISRKSWLFLALPIGIIVHLLVGKKTPMTNDFIDIQSHYILKILLLCLLILGIKDIKIIKKNSLKKEN